MKHLESVLKRELTRLYKEHYGKGPERTAVSITENILIIKIAGAMSQVEQTLIATPEGKDLALMIRDELILKQRSFVPDIEEIVGWKISEVCYAMDHKNNIVYFFLVFEEDLQKTKAERESLSGADKGSKSQTAPS